MNLNRQAHLHNEDASMTLSAGTKQSIARIAAADFSERFLETLETPSEEIHAWCVLPNHYHALVFTRKLPDLLSAVGLLHGRTAFHWNGEDDARGRKVGSVASRQA